MKQYLSLIRDILENGRVRKDRTGVGTTGVFGRQLRFNLAEGFPLVTTKKVHYKAIIHELLWFLEGSTDNNRLNERGAKIWDQWAAPDGQLGPIYGQQWRSWRGRVVAMKNVEPQCHDSHQMQFMGEPIYDTVDQLSELLDNLKRRPYSRRHVITAWNPSDLPDESISPQANVMCGKMALAPCHCLFQFYVEELSEEERLNTMNAEQLRAAQELHHEGLSFMAVLDQMGVPTKRLSCQLYQRSADVPVGVPFNIASYALLTLMIAQCVDMVPGDFIHTFGDAHIYLDQIDGVIEQLRRPVRRLPTMRLNPNVKNLFQFTEADFELLNYDPHPSIKYPVAV